MSVAQKAAEKVFVHVGFFSLFQHFSRAVMTLKIGETTLFQLEERLSMLFWKDIFCKVITSVVHFYDPII